MEIPVVPLDGLETNPDGLRRACHTVGLFYLDLGNHALPRRALAACAQFFALPDGAKAQMDVSNSPQWRGYIALGRENTQGKPDWREQVEFGAERPPLAGAFDAGRPLFERLIGPNQWPGEEQYPAAKGFRVEVGAVVQELTEIGERLMRALALSLGLAAGAFDHCFDPWPNIQYKVARYLSPAGQDAASGVGAHSDSGMLTLLVQDSHGGLEAQLAGGAWIKVPPREGMLVVNLGEMLQAATKGYYLATVHRVVNTPGIERLSFPFFYNAALSSPMHLTAADGTPYDISTQLPWEREIADRDASKWREDKNRILDIYGNNALKSLARSHPACTARHHADLVILPDGRVERRGA